MATEGIVYSGYAKSSRLYVSWTLVETDIANNRWKIRYAAGIEVGGGNLWYGNAVRIDSIYVGHSASLGSGTYSNFTANGTYEKFNDVIWIDGNPDGNRSFNISISGWFYQLGDVSGSKSFELPTIPRKSEIASVTFTDDAIERGFSVSFAPASTSFTHRVEVIADGETVASRDGYSAGSAITLTADELLALYRKNVKTVTVRLITKTNGSNIGTDDESKTLSAIGNAHIKVGGEWKRGVIHVGSKPGIVMIKKDGEWRVAR